MFHASADAIWSNRLSAYPDRYDNADLAGEVAEIPTHVELFGRVGVFLAGMDCVVTMEHDGDDWDIAEISYRSEFGGPTHAFDVARLRTSDPDGTLADIVEREILRLIDVQYNPLADAATVKARAA